MPYQRKTYDVWLVQEFTVRGWETLGGLTDLKFAKRHLAWERTRKPKRPVRLEKIRKPLEAEA